MTLARKLALRTGSLLAGLLLLAAASVWGLVGLSGYFHTAEDEYDQLRTVYAIGHHAAAARLLINDDSSDRTEILNQLNAALDQLQSLKDPRYDASTRVMSQYLRDAGERARQDANLRPHLPALNATLSQVADLAGRIRGSIIDNRHSASSHLQMTIVTIAAVAAMLILAGVWIGVAQYRSVMTPLRRLEQAVRRAAEADFTKRVPAERDREFAELAEQFNHMADRLDAMYRDLEHQVATRSRQLVQSERLASVGYLAAGLAHEINNPLGIICGYAEAALQRMNQATPKPDTESMQRAARALTIVCEEAMRCRDITSKLLSLARPTDTPREAVDLAAVVRRVSDLLSGLPQFEGRRVELDLADEPLIVTAHEAELTQVLINLVGNALEAVSGDGGVVTIRAKRQGANVSVDVIDNGRGMSEAVVQRVFEPFFTDKPQRDLRGTGLGLCVAHAIVTQHGGELTAHSDGENRGSRFTLRLPARSDVSAPAKAVTS